jgi:tRNA-binding protein
LSFDAFQQVEMRVARITRCEPNEAARRPSFKLWLDCGELGEKTSSARLTELYRPEDLVDRLVIAAVNLGTRRIAGFASEALVLGVPDAAGRVVILQPEREAPPGARVY